MPFSNISSFINSRFSAKESEPLINSLSIGKIEIDENWVIQKSHHHSSAVLLGSSQIQGKKFSQVLKNIICKRSYIQIVPVLKAITTNQSVINSAKHRNPFDCLKVRILSQNGVEITRHLRCEFSKSPGYERNRLWTVVIRDISKAVRLSNKIRRNAERTELKLSAVVSLLQFDRELIKNFLDFTISSLKDILTSLSQLSDTHIENKNRLELIYGIVHQIKCDAAILNLDSVNREAHLFENYLSRLNAQSELSRSDFVYLHSPLKSTINAVKEVRGMYECIVDSGWMSARSSDGSGGDSLLRQLQQRVKSLADEYSRQVIVVDDGYQDASIPLHLRLLVGRVVTQIARNAVTYGIEDVKTRMKHNKMPYGCIHVSVRLLEDHFVLTVRDDGRGIDPDTVRQAAIGSSFFDSKVVLSWNKAQLMNALFRPELSTAYTFGEGSGTYSGLDTIKSSVEEQGGRISIKSNLGQFTEFTMAFPR